MKWKLYLIGGLAAAGLIGGLYMQQIKLAEERGARAEMVRDYNELQAKHEADSTAAAVLLRAQKAETEEAVVALEAIEEDLVSFRRTARRQVSDLRSKLASLPDSVRGPVEATVAALEEEAEMCSLALSSCHLVIDRKDEEINTLEGDLGDTQRQLTDANLLIDRLGTPIKANTALPWTIAAVAVGGFVLLVVFGG